MILSNSPMVGTIIPVAFIWVAISRNISAAGIITSARFGFNLYCLIRCSVERAFNVSYISCSNLSYFTLFQTEREPTKFSAKISMRDVIVITILLRTYYKVYLLFLYFSRNTYIRKSIGTDSVKKYRIYENNELFPYSHSLRTCDWIGTRDLAQCGCQLYCCLLYTSPSPRDCS